MATYALRVAVLALAIHSFGWMLINIQGRKIGLNQNKSIVKTIKVGANETYDCYHILEQPAFNNPLLKDYKNKLNFFLNSQQFLASNQNSSQSSSSSSLYEVKCPQGTVPILRMDKDAHTEFIRPSGTAEYTAGYQTSLWKFGGGKGSFTVWALNGLSQSQSSGGFLCLNDDNGAVINEMVCAGWLIAPQLYGNPQPRLTARHIGKARGDCFAPACGGFIQISSALPVSKELKASTYQGEQVEVTIQIIYNPAAEGWILFAAEGGANLPLVQVGVWPSMLFSSLAVHATRVFPKGIVTSSQREPSPPMGSGHTPWDGLWQISADIRNVGYKWVDGGFGDEPGWMNRAVDGLAYDVGYLRTGQPDSNLEFYYGGPGGTVT